MLFFDCNNLTSIYAYGVTPVDLSTSVQVFEYVNKIICILHVPFGTSALYAVAFQWKDFINIVEIPVPESVGANQAICSGMIPVPLTSTNAGSGTGTISYRWEYSNNGIAWFTTGTSGETFAPGALTQTTLYRRITLSTLNGTNVESGPTDHVTVRVTPGNTITLYSAVGTDTQTLCANKAILNITYITTSATGATFNGLPGGVTGTWDSNVVTISGTPSAAGTFNYLVTLAGECGTITKSGSIVVNAFPVSPIVTISTSQNIVYAGTPVTFTATPVGGGTSPSFVWFLNNVARATGVSGTYTPKNGDVVYAEMTSGLACSTGPTRSNSVTLVVNPAPAGSVSINVSQNNICAGTPVTFTATPVEGGTSPTYNWYLNNIVRATGPTASYTPKNVDVVYAEMTSGLACVTGDPAKSNSVTMVVNQAPVESVSINVSQNNIPAGTPVTFTAIPVGGGTSPSFLWYLNNVARATGVTGSYAPQNGDEVYVVMTSDSPCASGNTTTSGVVRMIVDCVPAQPAFFTQGKAYVNQGQSDIIYTVPNATGVTYNWSYDGTGATITGTSNSVFISFSNTATSGTLSVRAFNNCGISDPRSAAITVATTVKAGILIDRAGQVMVDAPAEKNEFKVYPNPSSGPVTFEFRINQDAKVTLDLFTSSGMLISRIFEGNVEAELTQTVIFNESLTPGVYIYNLKWKDQMITGKLIRNR